MDTQTSWYGKMTVWQWATVLIGAAVVVSVVVYYALPMFDIGNNNIVSEQVTPTDSTQKTADADTSDTTTSDKLGDSVKTSGASSKLTYDQARAIAEYRFQFDNNCNGTTGITSGGALNVKQGSNIMLENHGDASHVIAIGNEAYTIAAGGFVVAKAPKVTTTTGLYITCDGGGAGNLFVNP